MRCSRSADIPGDEDKARELFGKLDQTKIRQDFVAATQLLMKRPDSTGKVGVVGFCYGGAMANTLATLVPELAAAVPFYGTAPNPGGRAEDQGRAADPLRRDRSAGERTAFLPTRRRSKANKIQYEAYTYPGTQHGFNNDTTPRFNAEAAKLAWSRTVEFFNKRLR